MSLELSSKDKKRLVFIKSIYRDGVKESKRAQPYASKSLLRFHDSVELFLKLVADKVGANHSGNNLMKYWQKINSVQGSDIKIEDKSSMKNLHQARDNLKHFDVKLQDVFRYRDDVKEFLEKHTEKVFGIPLSEVSEASIIENDKSREFFQKGNEKRENENHKEALEEYSKAFESLVMKFEEDKKDNFRRSPFSSSEDLRFLDIGSAETYGGSVSCPNSKSIEKLSSVVKDIQQTQKISMMGIDSQKFARFDAITPHTHRMGNGGLRNNWGSKSVEPNQKDSKFGKEFVVETAHILQSQDFDINYDM
ncbi:MAG: hypothetical protein ABEJ36_02990 [Candidatus Nanosalina sp.]